MKSKIQEDITKYLSDNSRADFESIESAMLRAILNSSGIYSVKNETIKNVICINTLPRRIASKWISQNIPNPTIQHALTLYEVRVSPESRKFDGAYYTPQNIVDAIVDLTVGNRIGSVCDPACGSGAFLLGSLKKLLSNKAGTIPKILSRYIWGIDIDIHNVENTKKVLSLFSILEGVDRKEFRIGIFQGNSLKFSWLATSRKKSSFDFIVGNPPYVRGRNLTSVLKAQIKSWPTADVGIADLYIPFFEIALSWVKNDAGRIGYITPNTYFSSINGRKVRKMISEARVIEKIIDLNGFPAFEGLLTYTCITILDKAHTPRPLVGVALRASQLSDIRKIRLFPINYSELRNHDWYIQPKKIISDMRQIESVGTPLTDYVLKFTTGIATLRNDLYIFNSPMKNGYITCEINGNFFDIEKEITVPIIKPNIINDEFKLKNNRERILYPYRLASDGKSINLIAEGELRNLYPGAYSYLKYIKPLLKKRSVDDSVSNWYAYGRSQALDGFGKKIIFPMMSNHPVFLWVDNPNTLIYCGYALFPRSYKDVKILLKILNSDVFWYYISNTSKNYANGYKSFAKNYVKKFSIPDLTDSQKELLLSLSPKKTNQYLNKLYGLRNR